MALLFEGICPLITQALLKNCKMNGIKTTTDFIAADPEDLVKKLQAPYKDVLLIQLSLINKCARFPQNARSLHRELLESISILGTGSKRLNRFLSGGIYTGEVTEIHGLPGAGKSQFCFSIVSNLILETKSTVFYLDTSCNFAGKRIEQILLQNSDNSQAVLNKLQNVIVKYVYDIYDLFECLDVIKSELSKQENPFFQYMKLLIIDSITPLLAPCFGGKFLDGLGLMGNVAQQFNALCCEHKLAVLVCNNTVQDKNLSRKPALGLNWKYVPSVSLYIDKVNGSSLHKIRTVKSCHNGHVEVAFKISEAGITD